MLIVEFTTAGGIVEGLDRSADISIEGLAMVKALVDDAIAGGFDIHILLHESIDPAIVLGGISVTVYTITNEDTLKTKLEEIAPKLDFCFLIAPEFGNVLYDFTCFLESLDCHVLSQPSNAIIDASDKKGSLDLLASANIRVPRSQAVGDFLQDMAFPFPVVVKPMHGAGCIGVFIARNYADIKAAMAINASLQLPVDELLVQEFIAGEQLSASAIATKDSCYLLGINEQSVILQPPKNMPSKYTGSVVGQIHPELWETCTSIARVIANSFSLDGYFGYDFILDEQGDVVVVEVNARLTTSFVGLKKLYDVSFLRFIVDFHGDMKSHELELPDVGFACYKILELNHMPGDGAWPRKILKIARENNVLMIVKDNQHIVLFISAIGITRQSALDELQKIVEKIIT